jgi:quercetin dioxygenase-like cupin family protein
MQKGKRMIESMKAAGSALLLVAMLASCGDESAPPHAAGYDYDVVASGTRQFEWDTTTTPAWIKVLVEEQNLGSRGAEVAEIFFPPEYQGTTHPHELEIIYVLEGELDHIVNGESHILQPGMVGIVREPDMVVHRSQSPQGVRVLVIWPLGGEVSGLAASGMRETRLDR